MDAVLVCIGMCLLLLGGVLIYVAVRKIPKGREQDEDSCRAKDELLSDAWWFSEDLLTMNLLRNLGTGMSTEMARDIWRRDKTPGPVGHQGPLTGPSSLPGAQGCSAEATAPSPNP